MLTRARACGLSLVLALAVAPTAHAADAKALYDKGTAAFALEKYGEAAEAYEAAFQLKPDPALLYNAAQAHRLAGNKQRALALYQNLLRVYGKQLKNRNELAERVQDLKTAIENEQKVTNAPPTNTVPPNQIPGEGDGSDTPPHTTTSSTTNPSEGSATALTATAPPKKEERPIYKKGWFWGVIAGSAVVVIGLGVGLGVGLSQTSYPTPSFGTAVGN